MQKYRKSDQYYIDKYDRLTINDLKEIDRLYKEAEIDFYKPDSMDDGSTVIGLKLKYTDKGIAASKRKREIINSWMERDESRDRLVQKYPATSESYCLICNDLMQFVDYDFTQSGLYR